MTATRASDADRDSCLEDIEAAYVDGRLNSVEREARTQAALQATTIDQLERLVADLRPQSFPSAQLKKRFDRGRTAGRPTGPALVPTRALRVLLAVTVVPALVAAVLWFSGNRGQDATAAPGEPTATQVPQGRLDLRSVAGIEELIAQIDAKFGTTVVEDASLYGDYASIEVPVAADSRRTERWYFAEGFEGDPSKDTRDLDATGVDLADLDVPMLVRAIKRAPAVLGVEDVTSLYAHVRALDGTPSFVVYVSNDYHESGYYEYGFDGTELYRSAFEPS